MSSFSNYLNLTDILCEGWGQTSFKADMGASKLRKLEMKVASNKECMAWSAKNSMNWDLKSSQVCAGAGSGKDACKVILSS